MGNMKALYTTGASFLLFVLCVAAWCQLARPSSGSLRSGQVIDIASGAHNNTVPPLPTLQQHHPAYVVQPEDVLALSFPLTPELNETVTVQPDGLITLQSAGAVRAQGLTVAKLVDAVKHAYNGVLNEPIVNINLQNFQKPFFTVDGEVQKPGQYELRANLNVEEGLALAGGMNENARTQVFLFHRISDGQVQVRKIDMKAILHGKHFNEQGSIAPGDIIYVPEKFISNFKKYVPYSVNAGTYLQPNPF